MKKSLGLILTLSAIAIVLGNGGTGHSFALEKQTPGATDTIADRADKSVGREGGQGGKSPHLEKRSEASRSRGEGRVGGQSGTETPLEEGTSSYGSMGGTRVGGQSGVRPHAGTSSSKAK